jgi:hypothetical protein
MCNQVREAAFFLYFVVASAPVYVVKISFFLNTKIRKIFAYSRKKQELMCKILKLICIILERS